MERPVKQMSLEYLSVFLNEMWILKKEHLNIWEEIL